MYEALYCSVVQSQRLTPDKLLSSFLNLSTERMLLKLFKTQATVKSTHSI